MLLINRQLCQFGDKLFIGAAIIFGIGFVIVLLDHVGGTLVGGDTGFGIQPATAMVRTAAFFEGSDKRPAQHDQHQNNDSVSNYITHNSPKYSLLVQFQIFQIPGGLNAILD